MVGFSNLGRRGVMRGRGRFAAPFHLGKIVSRPLLKLNRCEFLHGKYDGAIAGRRRRAHA
jgi:hypothetical protein